MGLAFSKMHSKNIATFKEYLQYLSCFIIFFSILIIIGILNKKAVASESIDIVATIIMLLSFGIFMLVVKKSSKSNGSSS